VAECGIYINCIIIIQSLAQSLLFPFLPRHYRTLTAFSWLVKVSCFSLTEIPGLQRRSGGPKNPCGLCLMTSGARRRRLAATHPLNSRRKCTSVLLLKVEQQSANSSSALSSKIGVGGGGSRLRRQLLHDATQGTMIMQEHKG